jgi:hypothetical protein
MPENNPPSLRVLVVLVICLALAACQTSPGTVLGGAAAASTQAAVEPTPTSPIVTGAIRVSDGENVVTGVPGQPLPVTVHFTAASSAGPVTEMRAAQVPACAADITNAASWEPFAPQKIFTISNPPVDITAFDVSVQYRDGQGNLSLFYCEDSAIQAAPPASTP